MKFKELNEAYHQLGPNLYYNDKSGELLTQDEVAHAEGARILAKLIFSPIILATIAGKAIYNSYKQGKISRQQAIEKVKQLEKEEEERRKQRAIEKTKEEEKRHEEARKIAQQELEREERESNLTGADAYSKFEETLKKGNQSRITTKERNLYMRIIAKDPPYAYSFAYQFVKGRWRPAEPYIMKDFNVSLLYVKHIIKHSWPDAEEYYVDNNEWLRRYHKILKSLQENEK